MSSTTLPTTNERTQERRRGAAAAGHDMKTTPYWAEDAVRPVIPETPVLPSAVDVVVVGSGYTGLHAALVSARGGRATVVFDEGDAGHGCSTRNGGQISTSIKPSLDRLTRLYGAERGRAIRAEGVTALHWIEEFVTAEGIDCDFRRCGRFHGAHTPAAFDRLAREAEGDPESEIVPRHEQRRELGTDFYHGGVVYRDYAALHPAKYHAGLVRRALEAGVTIMPHCPVAGIRREQRGFRVETACGALTARDVVVATNGYSGALLPWIRRRIIPVGSYIAATEPLPAGTIDRLFPTGRIATDTRRTVYYYRASPDRMRVLFGGRVSAMETDARLSAPHLHRDMAAIFPELGEVRLSHSWTGTVAYSFDHLAHCGVHDGIHYAMGYCGSGVSMASYLGMRLGQRLIGLAEGKTAFDGLKFPTRPAYTGRPWFLPAIVGWYRWRDSTEVRRACRG